MKLFEGGGGVKEVLRREIVLVVVVLVLVSPSVMARCVEATLVLVQGRIQFWAAVD